jgi:hypothetical protein
MPVLKFKGGSLVMSVFAYAELELARFRRGYELFFGGEWGSSF